MASTTTSSTSSAAASTTKKTSAMQKISAVWSEFQSHEKFTLFYTASSHNPDLQMSLDVVKRKIDNCLYKRSRDFVQDMNAVFTVDPHGPLASAATSFQSWFQFMLDKHGVDPTRKKKKSKRSKRASDVTFDFVTEFEEIGPDFLFEGEAFLDGGGSSSEDDIFGCKDDSDDDLFKSDGDASAEDFVPLSFSFEQESVLDGRSPALYPELLEYGWTEWEDPISDDLASPKSDDLESSGDSSSPSSPVSSTTTSAGGVSTSVKRTTKRQRSSSIRMRWSKEDLLFKITHELPNDKLEGIIYIVNPTLDLGDTDDEDLEFDINALDDATLSRLEDYVYACLADKDSRGDESMVDHGVADIIITETVATSPRKRTRTKATSTSTRSSRKATTKKTSTPAATKKSTKSTQRRKNASPAKTRSPAAAASGKKATKTPQVVETTICHFVEQDDDFNYIPHSRGARLNTLVPEAFEVFRTEQVIKVQKAMSDSDLDEEVDVI